MTEKRKVCHSVEIDFARTSYHSPRKATAASPFFPPPIPLPHFGGNYFCWRAVCDVYLPTGGWNDSKSEFEDKVSPRESTPPSLSLSFARVLAFDVIAFSFSPSLRLIPDSQIPLFSPLYPSPVCPIAIVRDDSRVKKKEKMFKRSFLRYPRSTRFIRMSSLFFQGEERRVIRYSIVNNAYNFLLAGRWPRYSEK